MSDQQPTITIEELARECNKVFNDSVASFGVGGYYPQILHAIKQAVAQVENEKNKFKEAFDRFGKHRASCEWSHDNTKDCSCGYVEAISDAGYQTQREKVESENQKLNRRVDRLHAEGDKLKSQLAEKRAEVSNLREMMAEWAKRLSDNQDGISIAVVENMTEALAHPKNSEDTK